jgi:hypothetical protein
MEFDDCGWLPTEHPPGLHNFQGMHVGDKILPKPKHADLFFFFFFFFCAAADGRSTAELTGQRNKKLP